MNWTSRQQVAGFGRVTARPGSRPPAQGASFAADYRGPSAAASTGDWWRPAAPDEPDLEWETAPVLEAADTTFTFIGESANLPENLYPPNRATLYAGGRRVLTFDLGRRAAGAWQEGEWALEFLPRQIHATVDGYHRQFQASGCCGEYRLAAPASALRAGEPLCLKVVLEPERSPATRWFAVRERSDVLEVSERVQAEQIAQLQQEIIQLQRIIGGLARRAYPELFPERLPAEQTVIYTHPRSHVHVPDLLRLQSGDLLCVFREGSEHVSCDGRFVMVRSRDNGKTWGERTVLREHPRTDERDGSIAQLRDGTLLAHIWPDPYYDAQGRCYPKPSPTYGGRRSGIYVGRSTDDGLTWVWPEEPIDPAPFTTVVSSERIIELPAGRLLMPNYYIPEDGRSYGCCLFCSDDRGHSWRFLSLMGALPGIRLDEPALLCTRSGRLIGMLRTEDGPEYYQVISDDGGETWTAPVPSGISGKSNPASLVQLPDGAVLCVHGQRGDPGAMYVVASYDEGASWDLAGRRVLRDDLPNFDLGYPSTVLLPDGRVLTAYYLNLFGRFAVVGDAFRWERKRGH